MNRQKKDKYLLTISIPAYGYSELLKKHVNKLLSIEEKNIEIVVVDNDPSGLQIRDFCVGIKDDRFKYYQNSQNIGRSNNIVKAIEKANASSVLIVSCQDEINIAIIPLLIKIIQKEKPYALIIGDVFSNGKKRKYIEKRLFYAQEISSGIKAVNSLKHFSNLFPFVVNKDFLIFDELYDIDETYMQYRIAIMAATKGSIYYLNKPMTVDLKTCDEQVLELYQNDWQLNSGFYNIGESYADPISRANQFTGYIDLVYSRLLNHRAVANYIEKMIEGYIDELHRYVIYSHSPECIFHKIAQKPMSYNEVVDCWMDYLTPYFQNASEEKKFDYLSKFNKKMKIERRKMEKASSVLNDLCYGGGDKIVFHALDKYNNGRIRIMIETLGCEETPTSNMKRTHFFVIYRKISRWLLSRILIVKIGKIVIASSDLCSYIISAWLSRPENVSYMSIKEQW